MKFRLVGKWPDIRIYLVDYNADILRMFISPDDTIPNYSASALAGDICNFLNDKYVEKQINEEWHLNHDTIEQRIAYHEKQLRRLRSGNFTKFSEHGNGVE